MVELRERAGGEGERAGGEGESRREGERDGGKIKDRATPQEKEKDTVIEVQRGTDVLVHQDDFYRDKRVGAYKFQSITGFPLAEQAETSTPCLPSEA